MFFCIIIVSVFGAPTTEGGAWRENAEILHSKWWQFTQFLTEEDYESCATRSRMISRSTPWIVVRSHQKITATKLLKDKWRLFLEEANKVLSFQARF